MAYDETLAGQIRELTADEPGLTERKVFGGLAFLIGGNMAVAASGQGGILVRIDPRESDTLVDKSNAHHLVMRGEAGYELTRKTFAPAASSRDGSKPA